MLDGRHDPNVSFDRVENIGIGHLHAYCEQKGGILDASSCTARRAATLGLN